MVKSDQKKLSVVQSSHQQQVQSREASQRKKSKKRKEDASAIYRHLDDPQTRMGSKKASKREVNNQSGTLLPDCVNKKGL